MATFLKAVSVVYLVVVWGVFTHLLIVPYPTIQQTQAFLIAFALSIPAAILFAFGQIVEDMRIVRDEARRQSECLRVIRA